MAELYFYAGEDFQIAHAAGSGIGIFGAGGAGYSISVNEYGDTAYITSTDGQTVFAQIDNVKWISASGYEGAGSVSGWLDALPNYLTTLNVRFTHGSAVRVQNVRLRGYYDTIATEPSGIIIQAAEIVHPLETAEPPASPSGWPFWMSLSGSTNVLWLANSPGMSGHYACGQEQTQQNETHGSNRTDTRHDWFVALSVSPQTVGSKVGNRIYVELEYL